MTAQLCPNRQLLTSRRQILQASSCGFGWLAFSSLATRLALADAKLPSTQHFPAKAKRVIFLCMRGGPSHVDTFDYKPALAKADGKQAIRPGSQWMASPWKFAQHGQSGRWVSELFPSLAKQVDKLCMIHSMQTDVPAHPQAMVRLHTGTSQFVRPSLGAWTLYGLGVENENLPGFISISPTSAFGGSQNFGSAFLPASYQATKLGAENRDASEAKIPNLEPTVGPKRQQMELDFIQAMNRSKLQREAVNPELEGVIKSYELAYRMQGEMPEVLDFSKESQATKDLYGLDRRTTSSFGSKCLMARRLVEAGVRFVEITHGNWDHHFNISQTLPASCEQVDHGLAGLLVDLEQRGMLDETLVVWTGEFGRTPYGQSKTGRDHNNKAFTTWMAGGGVSAGTSYGSSGEFGYEAVENPVPIVDFHATMLALLGLDHEKLTYKHAGRDFRLTDVKGRIIHDVIAS
jgi:Protein of unknown function (DUF1501)